MTINQQIEYILEHPFTKNAIQEYNNGNPDVLKQLLFEIHFHVFDKTALHCSKVYGVNKWNNTVVLKELIRHCEPPTNLSIVLSIPKKK